MLAFLPHPPVLLPEVGGAEAEKVSNIFRVCQDWAQGVVARGLESLLVISPHFSVLEDGFGYLRSPEVWGDLRAFGADEVKAIWKTDLSRMERLAQRAKGQLTLVGLPSRELDHGAMVPLSFLAQAGYTGKVSLMGLSGLGRWSHYQMGMFIREAMDERVGILASGDLSHALSPGAPAGYSAWGERFDQAVFESFLGGDSAQILGLSDEMVLGAKECGYRSLLILLGALDGYTWRSTPCYQAPFGVGYLAGVLEVTGRSASLYQAQREAWAEAHAQESPPVAWARQVISSYLMDKPAPPLPSLDELPPRAGVFVSLKIEGELRGCIGTIEPSESSTAGEIRANAIAAATRDPRFFPLTLRELEMAQIQVDCLVPPEPITGLEELDPRIYGVVVEEGGRKGLLLPMIEGIVTARQQVEIACKKAGIRFGPGTSLSRFQVVRYT